jgi:hypothetical protein
MSDTTQTVTTEEVKPVVVPEPEVVVKAEAAVAAVVASVVPDVLKADVEKIVKDVLKAAIKELLDDLKKSPLGKLDKDGDGVISAAEVKEQVQKLGCAPSCTIS